jgi:hypothetical protein
MTIECIQSSPIANVCTRSLTVPPILNFAGSDQNLVFGVQLLHSLQFCLTQSGEDLPSTDVFDFGGYLVSVVGGTVFYARRLKVGYAHILEAV